MNMREADQEIALAAEHVAEPAGNRQHDAVGDEIGGQRPGRLVVARRQAAGDMRQGDIDDGRVENLHERRERHRHRDRPRVDAWLPLLRSTSPAALIEPHRRHDRNAERQRQVRIEAAVDDDLDRHALHDLDEIAGRVLRREGGEFRARAQAGCCRHGPSARAADRRRRSIRTGWPGRMRSSWVSLKLAVTQTSGETIEKICWPGVT